MKTYFQEPDMELIEFSVSENITTSDPWLDLDENETPRL